MIINIMKILEKLLTLLVFTPIKIASHAVSNLLIWQQYDYTQLTKKPSVYWYEPSGKKRQKTFLQEQMQPSSRR